MSLRQKVMLSLAGPLLAPTYLWALGVDLRWLTPERAFVAVAAGLVLVAFSFLESL